MESGDEAIEKLQEWLKTKELRLKEIQHEQKAEREKQEQEKRIEFELKLHEAKIKMQAEAEVSTSFPGSSLFLRKDPEGDGKVSNYMFPLPHFTLRLQGVTVLYNHL